MQTAVVAVEDDGRDDQADQEGPDGAGQQARLGRVPDAATHRDDAQAADPVADPVAPPAAPPAAPPTNPNVVLDDIHTTSIADLVVEANEDVIATVSASGGFAFARSGGVTAVTGPDGATIIQTGDVTTPTEPSDDGGNNDLDFSS